MNHKAKRYQQAGRAAQKRHKRIHEELKNCVLDGSDTKQVWEFGRKLERANSAFYKAASYYMMSAFADFSKSDNPK